MAEGALLLLTQALGRDQEHVAEHLVGVVRDVSMARTMCAEHAVMMQNRAPDSRADSLRNSRTRGIIVS
jgi:hypothetical protein